MNDTKTTQEQTTPIVSVSNEDLSTRVGKANPGQRCSVCCAVGEQYGHRPTNVAESLQRFLDGLNRATWSSVEAREEGLRRLLAIGSGTAGTLDELFLVKKLGTLIITRLLPKALRSLGLIQEEPLKSQLFQAAIRCENCGNHDAARCATEIAWDAARLDGNASPDGKIIATGRPARLWTAADATGRAADAATDSVRLIAEAVAAFLTEDFVHFAADAAAVAVVAASEAVAVGVAVLAGHVVGSISWAPADQVLSEFLEEVVQILLSMKTPDPTPCFCKQCGNPSR
jgi:hypothetical protein